jgi:hypothetical protein
MQLLALLLCFGLAACSSTSENVLAQDVATLSDEQLLAGERQAAADSHFAPPIEVTDVIRANPNSAPAWLVCLRSAKSEESKRITYSAFFNTSAFFNPKGYVSSRYSVVLDPCSGQAYHPLKLG